MIPNFPWIKWQLVSDFSVIGSAPQGVFVVLKMETSDGKAPVDVGEENNPCFNKHIFTLYDTGYWNSVILKSDLMLPKLLNKLFNVHS